MRRGWLGLLVGALLTTGVQAQAPVATVTPGDRHVVHVTVQHPTTLTVVPAEPGAGETPVVWSATPVYGSTDVHIEREGRYRFTGSGPAGWFTIYRLDEVQDADWGGPVNLTPHEEPVWARIGGAIVLLAGLLGAAAFIVFRRLLQRRVSLDTRERELNEQNVSAGLFPTDGSLPARIPPYRVVDRLGSGGMAVVYRVENEAGEQFALKLPLPHLLSDARYLQRFLREAKIGMRLRHRNLVSLLYVNDDSNPECPWPYLVMELVDGKPLDRLLEERHSLPVEEAIPIVLDVLAGLEVVHRGGIVHRDIKPSNIMLMKNGVARLMDFGVAHKAQTQGGKLTGTEEILGTPRYMAPEQVQTKALDGRCDLYALGIVLYEMLAGEVPYGTDDAFLILGKKLSEPLPPLAGQVTVAPALAALVDRMVAIEPDDRPASATEVIAELRACLDGPPLQS